MTFKILRSPKTPAIWLFVVALTQTFAIAVFLAFSSTSCKEVIFTTDLGKTESISKVVFGTLHNPAYKALPAGKAVVEISTDGVNYKKVAEETFRRQLPENGRKAFTDEVIFAASDARYVRLTIQNGGTLRNGIDYRKDNGPATIQANLYLDEIEVY